MPWMASVRTTHHLLPTGSDEEINKPIDMIRCDLGHIGEHYEHTGTAPKAFMSKTMRERSAHSQREIVAMGDGQRQSSKRMFDV